MLKLFVLLGALLMPVQAWSADFYIHRGTTSITAGNTTATITESTDYTLQRTSKSASYAFLKIVSSNNAGNRGATDGNTNPDNATFTVSGTITTSQTFTRAASTIAATIEWEIIEYIGPASGANEFIVRGTGELATAAATDDAVTTGAISGVVSDSKMVAWITGQRSTTNASNTSADAAFIAAWNAGGDTITFTRRRSQNFVGTVSYAAIEFTGSNWANIQYVSHTYSAAATKEDATITTVGALSRTFLHLQQNFNNDNVQSQGHEVWLSATNTVSFRLATGSALTTTSVAWVIENTQTTGTPMVAAQYSGSTATNGNVNTTVTAVAATNNTSVEQPCATNPQASASFPTGVSNFTLTSTTNVQQWRARAVNTQSFFFATVEWPTAPTSSPTAQFKLRIQQ